jgi:hypothetical protein
MTDHFGRDTEAQELRRALQDAVSHRFDDVDFERLRARIVADAREGRAGGGAAHWELVQRWSRRGIPAAAALLAAGIAALLILPPATTEPAAAGAVFWPVAEELLSGVPDDTRLLIEAGSDVERLLNLMLAHEPADGGTS